MKWKDKVELVKMLNRSPTKEELSEFLLNRELDEQALEMLLTGVNVFSTALTPEAKDIVIRAMSSFEGTLSFRSQMRAKVWTEILNKL